MKIVIALRVDLLQRVIAATKDSGFQSEKYEPFYLRLRWTEKQLIDLASRRLAHLVKQRYTSRALTLEDAFPKLVQKTKFADFLCQRTSLRPREVILFVNECLGRAADRHQVTAQIVLDAEAAYSEKRLDSLQEEWASVYPLVNQYLKVLARKPSSFPASELSKPALEEWVTSALLSQHDADNDPVAETAKAHFLEGKGSTLDFVLVLIDALYVVGAVGVKPDPTSAPYWSHYSDHRPASGSIRPSSTLYVHPAFWRALGVRPH